MSGTTVDTADGTRVVTASVSTSDRTAALAAWAASAATAAVSLYMARARLSDSPGEVNDDTGV